MKQSAGFSALATSLWRALFVSTCSVCLLLPALLWAQTGKRYRPLPDYAQLSAPDQAEGKRLLEEIRQLGIPGDYYLEYELRMMPRRGEDSVYACRIWASHREDGPVIRLVLSDASGQETRLLIHNGRNPVLWAWKTGQGAVQRLGLADLFTPLGNTLMTPFDLEMPYLYWNDFSYEGLVKIRERPTYRFLMYPPADLAVSHPALTGVRLCVDTQFKAMVESVQLGDKGALLKTLSLTELKKTQGTWIVKSLDLRDEVSRSKTRLTVTAAATSLNFSHGLFEPEALADTISAPEASKIDRF